MVVHSSSCSSHPSVSSLGAVAALREALREAVAGRVPDAESSPLGGTAAVNQSGRNACACVLVSACARQPAGQSTC